MKIIFQKQTNEKKNNNFPRAQAGLRIQKGNENNNTKHEKNSFWVTRESERERKGERNLNRRKNGHTLTHSHIPSGTKLRLTAAALRDCAIYRQKRSLAPSLSLACARTHSRRFKCKRAKERVRVPSLAAEVDTHALYGGEIGSRTTMLVCVCVCACEPFPTKHQHVWLCVCTLYSLRVFFFTFRVRCFIAPLARSILLLSLLHCTIIHLAPPVFASPFSSSRSLYPLTVTDQTQYHLFTIYQQGGRAQKYSTVVCL